MQFDLFKAMSAAESDLKKHGNVEILVRRGYDKNYCVRLTLRTETNTHNSEFSVMENGKDYLKMNFEFMRAIHNIEKLLHKENSTNSIPQK